jgi:hypothetical protein
VELNLSEFHLNAISVRFFPRLGVLFGHYDDVATAQDFNVFAVGLFAAISSFHFRENLGYPQRTGYWPAATQNEGMNRTND